MRPPEYTEDEVRFLVENYHEFGARYCADKLGRSAKKISLKAFRLGLKVDKMTLRKNIMKDLVGKRFGKLTVLDKPPFKKNTNDLYWKCKCDCGNLVDIQGSNLSRGQKSCGCEGGNRKHGLAMKNAYKTNYKMWRSAKIRAKRAQMLFSILPEDIVIPDICPLLGIAICPSNYSAKDSSPSLDRIDNSIGYIPNNIWVISYKANRAKGNLSLSDLKMLVENLERKMVEREIHETRRS